MIKWLVRNYFSNRVVDIHCRNGENIRLGKLIETMNTGNTLFNNAFEIIEHGQTVLLPVVGQIATVVQKLINSLK